MIDENEMQNKEIFLSPEEKAFIKEIFEEKEIIDEDELKRLKELRSKCGLNSIVFGELYLNCFGYFSNNLHLFESEGYFNNLKSVINEFDKVEELRNLFENYGNGEEWGAHYTGEKIKYLVNKDRNKLNKLVNLFFEATNEND